jgi:hypothetical protein
VTHPSSPSTVSVAPCLVPSTDQNAPLSEKSIVHETLVLAVELEVEVLVLDIDVLDVVELEVDVLDVVELDVELEEEPPSVTLESPTVASPSLPPSLESPTVASRSLPPSLMDALEPELVLCASDPDDPLAGAHRSFWHASPALHVLFG